MVPVRVLVGAADPLSRGGIAALLGGRPEVAVAAQSAPELVAAVEAGAADAAAWDVAGAPLDRLREAAEAGLAILALARSEEEARDALAAGARGAVRRDAPAERIASALAALPRGLVALDATLAAGLLRPAPAAPSEGLTPRELEVLALLAEGLGNKAIAQRLGISEHTAKFHVNAILGKLGVASRAEAIVRAARLGMVVL